MRGHLFSRLLVLGWCVWLLGNWLIHGRMENWVAGPAMRWVLLSATLGLMLIWPALRLTDSSPHRSPRVVIGDLLAMWLIFQVIVLRLLLDWSGGSLVRTGWSLPRALLIDGVVLTWAITTAMWIDLGRRCAGTGRTLAMVMCVVGTFAGTLAAGVRSDTALALSPIRSLWELTGSTDLIDARPLAWRLAIITGACIVLWVVLARSISRRTARQAAPINEMG